MIKLEYYEKEKKLLAYNQDKINDSLDSYEFIADDSPPYNELLKARVLFA